MEMKVYLRAAVRSFASLLILSILPGGWRPLAASPASPAPAAPSTATTALEKAAADGETRVYYLHRATDAATRSLIVATGAGIFEVGEGYLFLEATGKEARALEALGFFLEEPPAGLPKAFPVADSGYHDYAEMVAELQQVASLHPDIFSLVSLGTTQEGRTIWAGKVSDHAAADEDEPEVLLVHHQHAREHLTVEQALYTLHMLVDGYGTEPRITRLVDGLETWIVFDLNPDGGEYDLANQAYRAWRKNRQPNAVSTGTDLNRNWGYRFGCCNGSSGDGRSETYRGNAAFSSPETAAIRAFVASRVIGGKQQIRLSADFHSFSELVMWPYGYTFADVPADMTRDDHDTMAAIGQAMAARNGYDAAQDSDLYITDGTIDDWLYGAYRIISFAIEMFPKSGGVNGFYPPDELIESETARNREALLYLLEQADCPYRAIGKQAQYCPAGPAGPAASGILFADGFDGPPTGWTVNAAHADTATAGAWEIGKPGSTRSGGVKQLTAQGGGFDLVTGRLAGANADANDLDGGTTSALSPPIALPATATRIDLRFYGYFAHDNRSSSADAFRVKVVGATTSTVATEAGGPANDNAAWKPFSISLKAFRGQTVRLRFECVDGAAASLVECAVDSLTVTATVPRP
jgi:carboxypeptidase T